MCVGFDRNYTKWVFHGESGSSNKMYSDEREKFSMHNDLDSLLEETFMMPPNLGENDFDDTIDEDNGEFDTETTRFSKLIRDAHQEVYPGSKNFSKLSIIVRLLHIKNLHGWSNVSFDMLLKVLEELLPENSCLPSSYQDCKLIIKDLGFSYEKIDSCPNDCVLFRKEYENEVRCPKCHASRYKEMKHQRFRRKVSSKVASLPIPAKVLRYFPLKQRIKRLFMSSKTAKSMKWHDEGRTKDGKLRHPADSLAWKTFDSIHPNFASDPRNVRLGLASDGFTPFKMMAKGHSIWPVVLMTYNLAPWDCMKQPYLMLSLLIPGPSSPKSSIDVYLEPLIDELKELWEKGFETYDASNKEFFQAHVALLWTINDLPAYSMLSGWTTSGKLACPVCNYHTCSRYLNNSKKMCYMCHRRWLDSKHRWRKDKNCFDGTQELRGAPTPLTGSNILDILGDRKNSFGNAQKKKRKKGDPWSKLSIFFNLPYWKTNLLRHNLDVMHIEKNICENVIRTILNIERKPKEHLKARLDLVEMGIRKDLHPINIGPNKVVLPHARFSLSLKEKGIFCRVLKEVKVLESYGSNVSRCVNLEQHNILGLKSHDFHILM